MNRNFRKCALGLVLGAIGVCNAALAAPVTITGYDIVDANLSGYGLWAHTYTGLITPTGGGAG